MYEFNSTLRSNNHYLFIVGTGIRNPQNTPIKARKLASAFTTSVVLFYGETPAIFSSAHGIGSIEV